MGTVNEWREVLIWGAFWGTYLMLSDVFRSRSRGKDPAPYLSFLTWLVDGFFFGFVLIFGLRGFRWPLVTILAPTIIAHVLLIFIYWKKMKALRSSNLISG